MTTFDSNKMNAIDLLNNVKARLSDAADIQAVEQVIEGIRAAKPTPALLCKEWKENKMNNLDFHLLRALCENDTVSEITMPIDGDMVEWEGICRMTGTVDGYSKDYYHITDENGTPVNVPAYKVFFERNTDKYDEYGGKYLSGVNNVWDLRDDKDRAWVRDNLYWVSSFGFRIFEYDGGGMGDNGCLMLIYESSDENAAMEQLFRARFDVRD